MYPIQPVGLRWQKSVFLSLPWYIQYIQYIVLKYIEYIVPLRGRRPPRMICGRGIRRGTGSPFFLREVSKSRFCRALGTAGRKRHESLSLFCVYLAAGRGRQENRVAEKTLVTKDAEKRNSSTSACML
jgi:hypothetical protein